LSPKTALGVQDKYSKDEIKRAIEYVNEKAGKMKISNIPGYIVAALEGKYQTISSYEIEKQKRQKSAERTREYLKEQEEVKRKKEMVREKVEQWRERNSELYSEVYQEEKEKWLSECEWYKDAKEKVIKQEVVRRTKNRIYREFLESSQS